MQCGSRPGRNGTAQTGRGLGDCLVSGLIYTGARPGSPVNVGVGAERWGGSFGDSVGISVPLGGGSRTYGNLAVDFIDVELNAQVWRGTLEAAFPTPEPDDAQVAPAVQQVLASLPAPATAAGQVAGSPWGVTAPCALTG